MASGKDDHRPGFEAALARCQQFGHADAARLDRITRRANTLTQLLADGFSVRAADMPGIDDLMMRVYAALAHRKRADQRARVSAVSGSFTDDDGADRHGGFTTVKISGSVVEQLAASAEPRAG